MTLKKIVLHTLSSANRSWYSKCSANASSVERVEIKIVKNEKEKGNIRMGG
jgi:hypothetical protein